jgi:hypothetical protein
MPPFLIPLSRGVGCAAGARRGVFTHVPVYFFYPCYKTKRAPKGLDYIISFKSEIANPKSKILLHSLGCGDAYDIKSVFEDNLSCLA